MELKSRLFWVFFCRMSFLRCMSYSPLLSFGPSILVPGSAYRFLHLSVFGVPQYPCRRQNLLCPLLTSALRSGCLSTSSVTEATQDSSPGVSSTAFRAQSPALRSASLMEVDFAVRSPLVRRSRLITGFCPSTRTFAPRFLQTSLQTSNLAPSIALAFCYPSPPSGWGRTFTSKLLNMPSTLRSRWRGGRGGAMGFACAIRELFVAGLGWASW